MVHEGCYNSKLTKPVKVLVSQPEILFVISNELRPDACGADMVSCYR